MSLERQRIQAHKHHRDFIHLFNFEMSMLVEVISFCIQGTNRSPDLNLPPPLPIASQCLAKDSQAYSHSAFTDGLSFELCDQEAAQTPSKALTGDDQIRCTDVPVNLCNRCKVEYIKVAVLKTIWMHWVTSQLESSTNIYCRFMECILFKYHWF